MTFNLFRAYIRAVCYLFKFSSFKKSKPSVIKATYVFKAKFLTSTLFFSVTLTQPRVEKWNFKLQLFSVHIIKTMYNKWQSFCLKNDTTELAFICRHAYFSRILFEAWGYHGHKFKDCFLRGCDGMILVNTCVPSMTGFCWPLLFPKNATQLSSKTPILPTYYTPSTL